MKHLVTLQLFLLVTCSSLWGEPDPAERSAISPRACEVHQRPTLEIVVLDNGRFSLDGVSFSEAQMRVIICRLYAAQPRIKMKLYVPTWLAVRLADRFASSAGIKDSDWAVVYPRVDKDGRVVVYPEKPASDGEQVSEGKGQPEREN